MLSRGAAAALREILARKVALEFGGMSKSEESFMVGVSARDFLNYVKVERGFLYDDYAPDERAEAYVENLMEAKPLVLASMLDEWFMLWAVKWRQRVKLAAKGDVDEEYARRVEQAARPFADTPLYAEAKRFALGSLVKSGEVCFTDLLSDIVVKSTLYFMVSRASGDEVRWALERNPVLLLSEITKRVRSMAKFKGPLVALKLERVVFEDKGFWLA
jgi:hypothetical protein